MSICFLLVSAFWLIYSLYMAGERFPLSLSKPKNSDRKGLASRNVLRNTISLENKQKAFSLFYGTSRSFTSKASQSYKGSKAIHDLRTLCFEAWTAYSIYSIKVTLGPPQIVYPSLWVSLTFGFQPCSPRAQPATNRVMGGTNVFVPLHASEAVFEHILKQWDLGFSFWPSLLELPALLCQNSL